jgi:uncharacterized membrane protein YciS (DUF1049 family)
MRLRLYAQTPWRLAAQLVADLLVLAWVVSWVRIGMTVHRVTLELAEPGRRLSAGADGVARNLAEAGGQVDRVPGVGDNLRQPFDRAAGAAGTIAEAGRRQVQTVQTLSTLLGIVVAAAPIAIVLLVWLVLRTRFALRATTAQRFVDAEPDLRLFALRAMANQPMRRIAAISTDPVAAWQNGDAAVIRALAVLELRDDGLVPPPAAGRGTAGRD